MEKYLYFHPHVSIGLKKKLKKRRATVAAQIGTGPNGLPYLTYGISVCSEKDQFIKARGRAAAAGIAKSSHPIREFFPTVDEAKNLTAYFVKKSIEVLGELGYAVLPKEKKEIVQEAAAQ